MVLHLENVAVSYDGVPALAAIDLAIHENQLTCFIGPSGCGKSSLLRCFNRLHDLDPRAEVTGKIRLRGRDLNSYQDVAIRRRIGMVFQRPNPFPKSVYENIALGLRVNGFRGDMDDRVEQALRQVALWDEVKDSLRRNAFYLSGGQQQRLCIARAIALGSEILLMDEPCSSLDPISSERINALLNEMKQHYTIIVVTHDLKQAAAIADQVAFFNVEIIHGQRVGRLVEYAPVPDIFVRPTQKATLDYIYHPSTTSITPR